MRKLLPSSPHWKLQIFSNSGIAEFSLRPPSCESSLSGQKCTRVPETVSLNLWKKTWQIAKKHFGLPGANDTAELDTAGFLHMQITRMKLNLMQNMIKGPDEVESCRDGRAFLRAFASRVPAFLDFAFAFPRSCAPA